MMDETNEDDIPLTQPVDNRILKDVIAYVEVRSANDNRSESVRKELEQLGATVVKKFTDDVTHVVFKEGCARTKTKALKKCVHFVSVLWVDRCKQNQEHVSERMFPAYVPKSKGTPLLFTKMKKAKSMQPRDFDEEVANSAEKVRRKRKKLEALHQARYSDSTPPYSPRSHPAILVQETQPRSSLGENEFVFTPVRLAIPDTPPGMREKMRELKMLKDDDDEYTPSDMEAEAKQEGLRFLQKKLFSGVSQMNDIENSVDTIDEEPGELHKSASDASVNKDILNLVTEINASLSRPGRGKKKYYDDFSEDTSLNCSQDSIDLLHTKDLDENPIPKNNVVESECVANDNVKDSEKAVNISTVVSGKNNVEKGKRKSRRSKRLSIQPLQLNDYVMENCNKKDSEQSVQITEKEKQLSVEDPSKADETGNPCTQGEDLELHLSMSTQNDDEDLQANLSPIKDTGNHDVIKESNLNVGSELEKNNPDIISEVSDKNKNDNCDKDSKSSKPRRRSSVLSNCKSRKANESCYLDLEPKATNKSNPQNDKVSKSHKDIKSVDQVNSTDVMNTTNGKKGDSCDKENKPSKPGRRTSSTVSKSKSNKINGTSDLDLAEKVSDNNLVDKGIDKIDPQKDGNKNPDAPVAEPKDQPQNPSKGKRVTKKKLMSLSDMMDQHSVLIEPSKASHEERKLLMDTSTVTTKMNKSRKSVSNQSRGDSSGKDTDNDNVTSTKRSRTNAKTIEKDQTNGKVTVDEKKNNNKENGQKRKKQPNDAQSKSKSKKSKTVLADETLIDNQKVTTEKRPLTDVTAQLNLTKDKSLTCSIRETTLSMSMSRAYPDGDMSSILASARRSIDEFSQKNVKKRKSKQPHINGFTSIREVDVSTSSSDSDRSLKRKKKNPSIVMTSLHSNEQDIVIQVVKKLGGFVITDNVNETTTHVICGEPRRTLNILQCLARGLWLLSKEWVIKSLEAGEWVPEESYECLDFFPTCRVVRVEREESTPYYRQTLFTSTGLIYISGRSSPPRPSLVQLVKLCGGQITANLEKANVYIGADFHPGITCVKTTWLLDCIKAHQTLPLDKYSLDRPKRESSPVY